MAGASRMKSLSNIDPQTLAGVGVVCTDIDDTLTRDGRLLPQAYSALWRLHEAGVAVIPVTGRPAGWCDAIVRQWPVRAVIGENGAFAYYLEGGIRKEIVHPNAHPGGLGDQADELIRAVQREVPQARASSDQEFRRYDLSIDYAEDEPRLSVEDADRIRVVLESHGLTVKISSIHVNAWLGSYTKLDMARQVFSTLLNLPEPEWHTAVLYAGDSPNDGPMFESFALSVGVANVAEWGDLLEYPPAWITASPYGAGFAELATMLLMARASRAAQ